MERIDKLTKNVQAKDKAAFQNQQAIESLRMREKKLQEQMVTTENDLIEQNQMIEEQL